MNFIQRRSKAYKIVCPSIFFLLLFIPTSGFPIRISATGAQPFEGKTAASVRDIALSNALWMAIEKAVEQIQPNLDDKSLQKLKGGDPLEFVKSYRILNETTAREEYKISIEANVDSDKLRNRLGVLAGVSSKPLGKPSSISIVVLQSPQSDPIIKSLSLTDVKREISAALLDSGYKVVEPLGDIRLQAYVSLKATESRVGETATYYVLGSVFVRAEDKNGKVVTEVNESSYSYGPDISQISLEVLNGAGDKAAERIKSEFDKRWNIDARVSSIMRENKNVTVKISFTDLRSYSQYEQLNNALLTAPGIDVIAERIFRYKEVSFLVLSKTNTDQLAKTLEKSTLRGFSLKLNNASSAGIEFTVVEK
jgi:hypothetical protein